MTETRFKATGLIVEAFEKHDVHFDVRTTEHFEEVRAGFNVDCGPDVIVHFISRDDDNDVSVRVFHLVSSIPEKKLPRALEACNFLNEDIRFVKFTLDKHRNINVEYDMTVSTGDDCVGEIAFEMFVRVMRILDSQYPVIMKALHTDVPLDHVEDEEEAPSAPKQDDASARLRELLQHRSRVEAIERLLSHRDDPGESVLPEGVPTFAEFLQMLGDGETGTDDTEEAV